MAKTKFRILATAALLICAGGSAFAQWDMYSRHKTNAFHIKVNPGASLVCDTLAYMTRTTDIALSQDPTKADTLWQVANDDTLISRAYISGGISNLYYEFTGSAIDLHIKVFAYAASVYKRYRGSSTKPEVPPLAGDWGDAGVTFTITTSDKKWIPLTALPLPAAQWYYFQIIGGAGNGADTEGVLKLSQWEP